MSKEFFTKVATVLEKAADYMDEQEAVKQAAVQAERSQAVGAFCEKYAAATGEELDPSVVERLARTDESLLDTFQKIASKLDNRDLDTLGETDGRTDGQPIYSSRKEAKEAQVKEAEDRFLSFCLE